MPAVCAGAAGWAAAIGVALALTIALVAWAADPRSGASVADAARYALMLWLVAHHVALSVPDGTLGLAPLGLMAVPLALLARAGRAVARDTAVATPSDAALAAAAVAAPYALVVTVGCSVAATRDVTPLLPTGLVGGAFVGFVGAGFGIVREAGLAAALTGRLPDGVRRSLRAGGVATAGLACAGLLLTLLAVVWHAGRVADVQSALGAGLVGGTALVLLCLLLLPNAAIAAVGYLAGPGFAVGSATTLSPFGVHLGRVPEVPLLGALPESVPALAPLLLLVPVAAGGIAGWLLVRRRADGAVLAAAMEGLGAGAVAGVAMVLLALLAGGPAGGRLMAAVGASSWQAGLAVAGEVGLPAAAVAAAALWLRASRSG